LLIRVGHSPDLDDAFTFWGIAADELDTRGLEFEHVLRDIQTLNRWALDGRLEVTSISLHAYPFVQARYAILPYGASMDSGYGPVVVSREPMSAERLRESELAVPGRLTTAYLVLRLFLGAGFRFREVPHDQVVDEVRSGRADAGILVDEGPLTYEAAGLHLVVDLGEWWLLETGLPLPQGVNVARRDLGGDALHTLSEVLGRSIAVGLENRTSALAHAAHRRAGLPERHSDRLVSVHVNEGTQDYGDEGRQAVRELLERGERAGAFEPVRVEFVA
jgi:1,4-dihydroxy-6-naphthoate synthase